MHYLPEGLDPNSEIVPPLSLSLFTTHFPQKAWNINQNRGPQKAGGSLDKSTLMDYAEREKILWPEPNNFHSEIT